MLMVIWIDEECGTSIQLTHSSVLRILIIKCMLMSVALAYMNVDVITS